MQLTDMKSTCLRTFCGHTGAMDCGGTTHKPQLSRSRNRTVLSNVPQPQSCCDDRILNRTSTFDKYSPFYTISFECLMIYLGRKLLSL